MQLFACAAQSGSLEEKVLVSFGDTLLYLVTVKTQKTDAALFEVFSMKLFLRTKVLVRVFLDCITKKKNQVDFQDSRKWKIARRKIRCENRKSVESISARLTIVLTTPC